MSVRQTALVLAFAAMGMSAVQAQGTFAGGDRGFVDSPTLTRAEVLKELQAFRRNPVDPDGGRYVGGQIGYAIPQHAYAKVNGEWVCTDKIAHNAAPDAIMTPAERRLRLQQLGYPG